MNALQTIKAMRDRKLIEGVLSASPLFRGAPQQQLAAVARSCRTLDARRGDLVAARGVSLPGVFAIAYGTMKLALRQGAAEERVVRLLQAGDSFGEAIALLGRPAAYEARAVTECKLVIIPSAAVFALIDRDPRSARRVVQTLAERNLSLLAELESTSTRGGAQRLASYLESLVDPAKSNGSCTVQLPAAKTVIAARLDMKKETLSRLLRALADRGLIEVAQREITILDRARLAEAVG